MEMVKIAQSMGFISRDLEMYHVETDTPALARTSNLNEDLGMVNTVLSDKTGTLTRNVMEFFKVRSAGTPVRRWERGGLVSGRRVRRVWRGGETLEAGRGACAKRDGVLQGALGQHCWCLHVGVDGGGQGAGAGRGLRRPVLDLEEQSIQFIDDTLILTLALDVPASTSLLPT
eukprot:313775-Chlamydomonas_euryale.AAC.1